MIFTGCVYMTAILFVRVIRNYVLFYETWVQGCYVYHVIIKSIFYLSNSKDRSEV